ncbi:hypothetical protein [Streptomyces reniochalinae]
MANYTYFQEGSTYGEEDLTRFNKLWLGDSSGAHLITSGGGFSISSNTDDRTVKVNPGKAFIYDGVGGYYAVETTATSYVDVATASTANPRRDLVYLQMTSTGPEIKIATGTPAASPTAPARPAKSIALCWVDVPKNSLTFTGTPTRYTGQYRDQMLIPGPGVFAVDWAGELPDASGFRHGATVYCMSNNQRWTRTAAGKRHTTDPGPWFKCTPQNVAAKDGTNITVTGDLYIRESSTEWELSGQLSLSPSKDLETLVLLARVPDQVSRPTQNTYGASGQTYGSTSAGGTGRIALMTSGQIEYGSDGVIANLYCNEQFSKSPWNTNS